MAKAPKQAKNPKEGLSRLESAKAKLIDEFGQEIISSGYIPVDAISTGIAGIDTAIGCGGLPRGRVIEIFGSESSGKTTLALQFVAQCQRNNGVAAYIDAEHALDPKWASNLGVNWADLVLCQPNSGEEGLKVVEALTDGSTVDLVVVDSVPALVPEEELKGELTDTSVGAQARMLSKALRRLTGKCSKSDTAVLFINQLRDKIGGGFSPSWMKQEQTPGGRALKFYASLRMELKKGATLKIGEKPIGQQTKVKIVKNKVAPPFTATELEVYFGHNQVYGAHKQKSLMEAVLKTKIVTMRGSNYYSGDTKIATGKDNLVKVLTDDQELYGNLYAGLLEHLRSFKDSSEPALDSVIESGFEEEPEESMDE